MTEANTTEELANQFASFNPEALKKTFDDLNAMIHSKAKPVSADLSSLKTGLEALLPHLDDMQSLLSQRGQRREAFDAAGLRGWTEWFRKFKAETGLNVTIRAVQKQLAKLRGTKPRKKPDPPVNLSQRDQRRLLSAQQFANELVAAIDHGADYSEPLHEYKRVALGADTIAGFLESVKSETTHETAQACVSVTSEIPVATAEVSTPDASSASAFETQQNPSQQFPSVKPGDWSATASLVGSLCGEQLRSAFAGLPPEVMADVFGKFVQRLAQTYRVSADGVPREMQIAVAPIRRTPPRLAKAFYRDFETPFGAA